MISSLDRKRGREPAEEAESLHCEKRPRWLAGREREDMMSDSALLPVDIASMDPSGLFSNEGGIQTNSTMSEPESSGTDVDMDTGSDFRMNFSQSPEQSSSSSWTLRSSPIRNPRMAIDDHGTRVPTPIIASTIRPQPMPVQMPLHQTMAMHTLSASTARTHLGYSMERFPSPISEDEPHTPTTAAGSQLSLLTVTDHDMDMEPPEPEPEPPTQLEPMTVRKQRQRSGAFTSPREPSKKFTMGYREDCDKCRDRVPGHMNHFLGS